MCGPTVSSGRQANRDVGYKYRLTSGQQATFRARKQPRSQKRAPPPPPLGARAESKASRAPPCRCRSTEAWRARSRRPPARCSHREAGGRAPGRARRPPLRVRRLLRCARPARPFARMRVPATSSPSAPGRRVRPRRQGLRRFRSLHVSENLQFNGHHGHLMVTPGCHFHCLITSGQ
jgi:hypothetical protein